MSFGRVLIIGYGSIGQGLTPLLFHHFPMLRPDRVNVVAADEDGREIAKAYGIGFHVCTIAQTNYMDILRGFLSPGDLLINVSVNVSSFDLILWCRLNDVLYIDTCVEPWAGGYDDARYPVSHTTNYWLRENVLELRGKGRPTALVAHGANPGLVSHFVKQGLLELARLRGIDQTLSFGKIAQRAGVRAIHIAERDTQDDGLPLRPGEFANTWSVDGLLSEAYQRAEVGWGTHEKTLPFDAVQHAFGSRCGIFLDSHSATVKVSSWVPSRGCQSAYLITHHEALSIADFLTVRGSENQSLYRPTVLYAYRPTEKTCQSLENWIASGFKEPSRKTLMRDAIETGYDELGALFIFEGGAYWFGSTLTHAEATALVPHNNATSLQVAASIIGALEWMSEHRHEGVVEAEGICHQTILSAASPYLGQVRGVETDWQPAGDGQLQFADFLEACSIR